MTRGRPRSPGSARLAQRAAPSTPRPGTVLARVAPDARERAERLLAYGARHLGGVVDGGEDTAGIWLLRVADEETLHALLKRRSKAAPTRDEVSAWLRVARDIAEGLTCAEEHDDFPGPLAPESVLLLEGRAHVGAEAIFERELGERPRPDGSLAPIWCPPAQVDGAPFDHAANRWVFGLILYKLFTGTHPFAGGGLRAALEAAATREAPPFPQEIAAELPPGVQALTLRLLHPDAARRPASAADVSDALLRASGGDPSAGAAQRSGGSDAKDDAGRAPRARREDARPRSEAPGAAPKTPPPAPARRRAVPRGVALLLPIGLGAAVAIAAVTQLEPPRTEARTRVEIDPAAKIGEDALLAGDCASCHARQASEWRRSVMGHALKSPLFNSLESLIEEQFGRDLDCPNGAGALRKADPSTACRSRQTGFTLTGTGGEHWCVNCHAPSENLEQKMPAWDARAGGDARSRFPVRDLIGARGLEGISCGSCHQTHGPVSPRGRGYQGNPSWTSFVSGQVFPSRPEDRSGVFGIANSGYALEPQAFLLGGARAPEGSGGDRVPHRLHDEAMRGYLRSSEFCGSCHDVRLFGSDAIGARERGEHFKRLRNGYTEWTQWAALERRKGRTPATCQDCHMSTFPGVCAIDPAAGAREPGGGAREGVRLLEGDVCPPGTRFEARAPGAYAEGRVASSSKLPSPITSHYFSGVDLPLAREYPEDLLDEDALDLAGLPISAKGRRDALLRAAFKFEIGQPRLSGGRASIPIEIENVGGGHRVPAGFSQEREFWVELEVRDAGGKLLYQVGHLDRADEDLRDKVFVRVNTDPNLVDGQGRPVGLFGADVRDGPDRPEWTPGPETGATSMRGKGLINFQNGFLRCVRCIGEIAADGSCQPGPGQGLTRADRFDEAAYDIDTGNCNSNLDDRHALFETYFPVGGLDASRGLPKAPDAIIDTRSAPPGVPLRYAYELDVGRARGPLTVKARLLFRAFPPYLIRAFADYERQMDRLGRRPSGPLVDLEMLKRLEIVELAKVERKVEP